MNARQGPRVAALAFVARRSSRTAVPRRVERLGSCVNSVAPDGNCASIMSARKSLSSAHRSHRAVIGGRAGWF